MYCMQCVYVVSNLGGMVTLSFVVCLVVNSDVHVGVYSDHMYFCIMCSVLFFGIGLLVGVY